MISTWGHLWEFGVVSQSYDSVKNLIFFLAMKMYCANAMALKRGRGVIEGKNEIDRWGFSDTCPCKLKKLHS